MPSDTEAKPASWALRLGWLVLIWGLSVVTLGVLAGLMRLFMNAAGLTA